MEQRGRRSRSIRLHRLARMAGWRSIRAAMRSWCSAATPASTSRISGPTRPRPGSCRSWMPSAGAGAWPG